MGVEKDTHLETPINFIQDNVN